MDVPVKVRLVPRNSLDFWTVPTFILHKLQMSNFMDLKYGTKTAVITETTFIFNILNLSADDVTERQIWLSEHIGEFYVLRQFVT